MVDPMSHSVAAEVAEIWFDAPEKYATGGQWFHVGALRHFGPVIQRG
ncbi:hypothetical protein BH09GEM1_BH09GEM1_30010 [soil metagenome]